MNKVQQYDRAEQKMNAHAALHVILTTHKDYINSKGELDDDVQNMFSSLIRLAESKVEAYAQLKLSLILDVYEPADTDDSDLDRVREEEEQAYNQ